jgi:translation initiation factor 4E
VTSVEEFFCVYNNTLPLSHLTVGEDMSFFRGDIKPEWEDPANGNGGKWQFTFPKGKRGVMDKGWLVLILAIVGNDLEDGDHITGVIASCRQMQCRIALWTRDGTQESKVRNVGKAVAEKLGLKEGSLRYTLHRDSAKKNSSKSVHSITL